MPVENDQFDFNDRYGIAPARAWVKYAAGFAIVGGAWLLWAGLHQANPALRYELIAFSNTDPRNPEIRFLGKEPTALKKFNAHSLRAIMKRTWWDKLISLSQLAKPILSPHMSFLPAQMRSMWAFHVVALCPKIALYDCATDLAYPRSS